MYKSSPLLQRTFLAASVSFATPAHALFDGVPGLEQLEDGAEHFVEEGGKILEKGGRELANGMKDISKEGEKLVRKTFKEMDNARKDLEMLAKEGKCGGDICIAIEAAVEFSANNIKETGDVWKETGKRLSEGKPLDAMWHLAVDPVNHQQENAAEAAMKSSVLRAVGQVAASAYFGPGGAAAYASWLTYHSTDGNIELALKAGAIAGATAYAMDAISKDVAVVDVAKNMKADEIVQRAVMSGAVSGLAVALSGGTKEEIEQAFTKGAVTSVIRDGYKELTKSHLQDNMKASQGLAYCLGADPNAVDAQTGNRLGCLPDAKAYINKDGTPVEVGPDGKIDVSRLKLDRYGKPEIEVTELDYARPHVGTFTEVEKAKFAGETSDFMTGVSRIPGMNGMSIAHDIFVGTTDDVFPMGVDLAYSVGTIAPFVVMTYEGAGFGVQEMIRDVNARSQKIAAVDNVVAPEASPGGEAVASAPELKTKGTLENSTPVEIRHLYCKRGDDPVKNFLMESPIPASDPAEYKRICRIDQNLGGDRWAHLWHAHHEKSFCTVKFNDMLERYVERGYTCYANRGVRFDQANTEPKKTEMALSP